MNIKIKPMTKRKLPIPIYEYSLILDDEQCAELHEIIFLLLNAATAERIPLHESQIAFIANIQTQLELRDLN